MPRAVGIRSLLIVLIVLAVSPVGAAEEGVLLKWNFEAGQVSRYTSSQDIKLNVKQGVLAQELLMKQTSDIRWVVDSLGDDGNAHITQTVERIQVESGPADDLVKFDSSDDKQPEEVDETSIAALRAGVNQPIYLVLDPRGQVLDVRLSEQFAQRLKESPQYGPLAAMFSRDTLKRMASMNTIELPPEPVHKGATWEQQTTLSDPYTGKQKVVTTYRYDGAVQRESRRLEKISATAKILPADEKAVEEGKPAPLTIKEQKLNGVIWFDRARGRIDELEMQMKVVSELAGGANKVDQTMVTKLHTRLLPEEK